VRSDAASEDGYGKGRVHAAIPAGLAQIRWTIDDSRRFEHASRSPKCGAFFCIVCILEKRYEHTRHDANPRASSSTTLSARGRRRFTAKGSDSRVIRGGLRWQGGRLVTSLQHVGRIAGYTRFVPLTTARRPACDTPARSSLLRAPHEPRSPTKLRRACRPWRL
jgi:hypothetical protein